MKISEQTDLQSNHFISLVISVLITNPALSSAHPHPHYKTPLFNSEIQTPHGSDLRCSDAAGCDYGAAKVGSENNTGASRHMAASQSEQN